LYDVQFPVRSFGSPRTVGLAWRCIWWIRRNQVALVHPFAVPTVLFAVPLSRLARVPIVLSSQRRDRRLFSRDTQHALTVIDRIAGPRTSWGSSATALASTRWKRWPAASASSTVRRSPRPPSTSPRGTGASTFTR
jgi:hypothetical protein